MNKFVPNAISKIGFTVLVLLLFLSTQSNGQCLPDWEYTTPVTVDNSANASVLTDFQVQFTIATDVLIAANKMNPDGSDIRFTDVSCNPLDYWIESGINTATTVIWVEVNSIPANGSATINMFYGNSTATSASDADATFALHDDFDTGISDFTTFCGNITDNTTTSSNLNLAWSSNGLLGSNASFDFNEIYTAEAMMNSTSGTWPAIYWGTETSQETYALMVNTTQARVSVQGSGNTWCSGHNWASTPVTYSTTAGLWSLTWIATGSLTAEFPSIGTITSSDNLYAKDENLKLLLGGISSGTGSMNLDWIRVRKYAPTEPVQSVGSESVNYRITNSIPKLAFCPQETFDVTYTAIGVFLPGNEFIVELSDASGSFTSPVELGKVTSQTSGVISATIAESQVDGSAYRIRVVSNNPSTSVTYNNGADITIHPIVTANFDASLACVGNPTSFTDLSTIVSGTIDAYEYQFGNGSVSNLKNLNYVYPNTGNFDVTLTVTSNMGCTDDTTLSITVFDKPSADFTFNNNCVGVASEFTNTSTGATSYNWNFGEGGTSTDTDPTYTYAQAGTYTVSLIAENADGCTDTVEQNINVYANPNADFTAISNCANDTVSFTNTSSFSGTGMLSYDWDFGNGDTSTNESPYVIYSISGSYTVSLIATSDQSCADTTYKSVTAYPNPVAGFTADSVCLGDVLAFNNQSTISSGSISYTWDFGDGNTSTNVQATHTYGSVGTFEVILWAESNMGCVDTDTQTVVIYEQPIASFTSNTACNSDTTFFTNNSIGSNLTYTWDFGDNGIDSVSNPTHIYTDAGTYTVILSISNNNGCADTYQSSVTVYPSPEASFTVVEDTVCLDKAVAFVNTSTLSVGASNYLWLFGDSATSTDINPSHLYDTAGIYEVTLIHTSDMGCTDTARNTHVVYPIPEANFSLGNSCYGDTVDFTNLSTIDFGNLNYVWDFSDGINDTATNPQHLFNALGIYDITLDVTSDFECFDQMVKKITVYPVPNANFTFNNGCEDDEVSFTNLSTISAGQITYNWEFSDSFSTQSKNPVHLFDGYGDFGVELTVTSAFGCTDTSWDTVTIYPLPDVSFNADPVCFGEITLFENTTTLPDSSAINDWFWSFGVQDAAFIENPSYQYSAPGAYDVLLQATSPKGCVDTTIKTVIVNELPNNTITPLGPTSFCDGDSVELSADPLVDFYTWSNGDTTQKTIITVDGTYNLTVESSFGCIDSNSIEITVWELPDVVAYKDTTLSKGYSAYLSATGAVFYQWTPEFDLESPSSPETLATPFDSTRFVVVGTDLNGCENTDSVTVLVLEDYKVEATNVITPNGDGVNDFWEIINIETYPDVEVSIYNRYGNELFNTMQYQNEWDGKYNGNELPEGTYYYTIRFDGSEKIYKGAVSILR